MKKLLILLFILFSLTACNTKEEDAKTVYLEKKSILNEKKEFNNKDELPFSYKLNLDRKDKEKLSYDIYLYDLHEDMHNIKAMAVHNYYSEDLFPTIGLSTNKVDKTKNDNIELTGTIETEESISSLSLKFKVWFQYTDEDDNVKNLYFVI